MPKGQFLLDVCDTDMYADTYASLEMDILGVSWKYCLSVDLDDKAPCI